jgi:lipopolysaccharide transport system permease protein
VKGFSVKINAYILLLPLLVLMVCLLGLAIGLIMASVTAKYRDLSVLFSYGISLFMYVTPVIYPVSSLSGSIKTICLLNPMAPIIETVRYGVFSSGAPQIKFLLIGAVTTFVLLYIGLVFFNKTEKTFIDII